MSCSSCDRENVIRSYCYFIHRPELFYAITGTQFSIETFAKYAVEMDLKWRTEVCCEKTEKDQLKGYWQDIKDVLKEVLQRHMETLED